MAKVEFLTLRDCDYVVRNYLKTEDVQAVDFAIKKIKKNDFAVKITVNHNDEEKILNFYGKTRNGCLMKELEGVIPKIHKITPRSYYNKSDLLLFEDLGKKGFVKAEGIFNLEQIQLVLGVLAKLHAGSLIFEDNQRKKVTKYKLNHEYKLSNPIENLPDSSSFLSKEETLELTKRLAQNPVSSNFAKTLCHGSLASNIMFRCEETKPVECKLINFETKHYAPPLYDVLQLIFFNTNQAFRQHHLEDILNLYYSSLKKELEKYSLDINEILPYKDVELITHFLLPLIKLQTPAAHEELKELIACPILGRENCYQIVRNKLKTTDYDFQSFKVSPIDKVNGFLGDYHTLQIKIRRNQLDEEINCFVKCIPKGGTSKGIVLETGAFFKEVFVYQTLVPEMKKRGVNTIDGCLAACYYQRAEDLIVFEDLALLGFKTMPSRLPLDHTLVNMILKKVAKMHASFLMFEEKKSEEVGHRYRMDHEYHEFTKEVFHLRDANHSGAKIFQAGVKSIPDALNLFPDLKTEKNLENFAKAWPKLPDIYFNVIKTSERYRNVLSHGDLWTNNILVRHQGGEAVDCCFVDFQCTRYCPPAYDFLSIVYLTTNRQVRALHYQSMVDAYYGELVRVLALNHYDCKDILPFGEFLESVEFMRPQMVMQTIQYCMFSMCTSEEIAVFVGDDATSSKVFFEDRKEYLAKMCQTSELYKDKMKECSMDVYDLCASLV